MFRLSVDAFKVMKKIKPLAAEIQRLREKQDRSEQTLSSAFVFTLLIINTLSEHSFIK